MRLRPYRTVEDKIDGVVVTFVDIGERRRAEEALRDSEARIRSVIDGVADAIVTIDEHGRIQSLNAAARRMFGYAADELVERDANLLGPQPEDSQPADFARVSSRSGRAARSG